MELFPVRIAGGVSWSRTHYVPSRDGQRFLMIKNAPGAESSVSSPQIVVVQNWLQEWQRLRASLRSQRRPPEPTRTIQIWPSGI